MNRLHPPLTPHDSDNQTFAKSSTRCPVCNALLLLVVFGKVKIFTTSCKERLVEEVRLVEKERVVEFLLSPMGGDLQVFSE